MHEDVFRDAGAFQNIINSCFTRWHDTLAGAANDIQRFISSVPPTDSDAASGSSLFSIARCNPRRQQMFSSQPKYSNPAQEHGLAIRIP